MRIRSLIILSALAAAMPALHPQADAKNAQTLIQPFQDRYNAGDYEKIFDLFTAEMKAALPLKDAAGFFGQLNGAYGKLMSVEFKRYANPYYLCKANFANGVFLLKIAFDPAGKIAGLFFGAYSEKEYPVIERNLSPLVLPFAGEWTVFWGGDTVEQNYHVAFLPQKNAFDFLIADAKGRTFKSDGKANEDYYAYGQNVLSPCDGEVVMAVDGVNDNEPGIMNPLYAPGNSVVIKTDKGEYAFLCHFIPYSIEVKVGMKLKRGDLLGRCGNSGNSSEPHIHFHLQNSPDINYGTGIKAFFADIAVDGAPKKDYSPVKGEKAKNAGK